MHRLVACITFLLLFSATILILGENSRARANSPFPQETLWIDADSNLGELELHNGFLHGQDEQSPVPNPELIQMLGPEEWRLYKYNSYQLAFTHQANITYGLCDHYAWYKGGFQYANPWEDWEEYEAYILYIMQVYDSYFPDYPAEYYDIWNEPDHPYFWHGTYEQLVELFYRGYTVVKSYKPEAKVVGPSISWFRPGHSGVEGIIDLLVDLDTQHGVRFDAISWHENGGVWVDTRPDGIPSRAQYLRDQIDAHFPPHYTPEFHINEFMGGQVHLSPGWNVAYLYYLEEAGIDKAMRACWWVYSIYPYYDYWCDCWYGLNGMFMKQGQTPQPAYWVWLTHAEMEGEKRLNTTSSDIHTNVIATRDPSSNIIHLLTGRHLKSSPHNVYVQVTDYGYSQTDVFLKVEMVPNYPEFYDDPPQAIAMPDGPLEVEAKILPVMNEEVQFAIESFNDGDAFILTLYPPPETPELAGPQKGKPKVEYKYSVMTQTPDQSAVYYYIDWGDDTSSDWIGPYPSGEEALVSHAWSKQGIFGVKCKAKTSYDLESDWSKPLVVNISQWDTHFNSTQGGKMMPK